ncbi:hypothetical protein Mgra_00004705 [Meloidogyne graminicola]|uniref:WAP domain-containing protein n=1 Tax=Meloidogyne graminicola TaxID=189291 RepID=A0A8S9ZRC7_9BILA|nr:hypothetical protein Mgra_00004705 [Meloidogyne graminicola]
MLSLILCIYCLFSNRTILLFMVLGRVMLKLWTSNKNDEIESSSVKIVDINEKENLIIDGECPKIIVNPSTTEWCPVQCFNDLDCSEQPIRKRCCPNECGGWKCISTKNSLLSSSIRPPVQIQPLKNNLNIQQLIKTKNEEDFKREELSQNNIILLRPNNIITNSLLKCESVKCLNPLYECQLVELDCLTKNNPCPTIAKCLLNPCPNGICPFKKSFSNYRLNDKKCEAKCKSDEDCLEKEEKCCFNGCELNNNELIIERPSQTKYKTKIKTTNEQQINELFKKQNIKEEINNNNELINEEIKKIGNCPKISKLKLTMFEQLCNKGYENGNECKDDNDCYGFLKCCSNICGNKLICLYPENEIPKCLLIRISAEIFSKFSDFNKMLKPKCDRYGNYFPIQNSDGFTWCVDNIGNELIGTRTPSESFISCELRRICPLINCDLKCPFGFQLNGLGCPQCICRAPLCDSIQCPLGTVCRYKCPPGFYCQKLGIGENGYCCSGLVLQNNLIISATKCPILPNLLYIQNQTQLNGINGKQIIGCRLTSECKEIRKICCFNGWGSECYKEENEEIKENEEKIKIINLKLENNNELNNKKELILNNELSEVNSKCPNYLINASNPGCVNTCFTNKDCFDRNKYSICCQVGCGKQCKFPEKANLCIHLFEKLDKLSKNKYLINKYQNNNNILLPQCTPNGLFKTIQYDEINGQYWCVNQNTGIELLVLMKIKILKFVIKIQQNVVKMRNEGEEMFEEEKQNNLNNSSQIITTLIAFQSETTQQIQLTTEESSTIFKESLNEEKDNYQCNYYNTNNNSIFNNLLKLPIYCNPNENINFCPNNFKCIRKPFLLKEEEEEEDKLGICCPINKEENELEIQKQFEQNNSEEKEEFYSNCFLPMDQGNKGKY